MKSWLALLLAVACAGTEPIDVEEGGWECTEETPEYCVPPTQCELLEQAPVMTSRLLAEYYEHRCWEDSE